MYTTIWHYRVAPGRERDFEAYHGAAGPWVQLFRRAKGFRDTVLLRDVERTDEYVTFDRWDSADDYARFRAEFRDEYARLDVAAEALTSLERHIGGFDVIG